MTAYQGRRTRPAPNWKPCRDHTGAEFPSEMAMCRAWDVEPTTYAQRRGKGMTVEEALTLPRDGNRTPCRDHLGNEFRSIRAMCKAYGIRFPTYANRIERNWTVEQALTTKPETLSETKDWKGGEVPATDHKGNEYPSITKMCEAYSIPPNIYSGRIKLNWTVERALTEPVQAGSKQCADYMGRTYPSKTKMCAFLGLKAHRRQENPKTPAKWARICEIDWTGRDCGIYLNIRPLRFPWFLADAGGHQVTVHFERLLEALHEKDKEPETEVST